MHYNWWLNSIKLYCQPNQQSYCMYWKWPLMQFLWIKDNIDHIIAGSKLVHLVSDNSVGYAITLYCNCIIIFQLKTFPSKSPAKPTELLETRCINLDPTIVRDQYYILIHKSWQNSFYWIRSPVIIMLVFRDFTLPDCGLARWWSFPPGKWRCPPR